MTALLVHMFPPSVGKSGSSYALSGMSYFYDFERLGIFAFPKPILRKAAAELFKTHKADTASGKTKRAGSLNKPKIVILQFDLTIPHFDPEDPNNI
jgi:hypothetical protein